MKSWLAGWVIVFGVVVAPLARAEVLIVPVERVNVTEVEGDSIAALLSDAYAEVSHEQMLRGAPVAKAEGTPESYSEVARAKRAQEYIVIKATRLNSRVVLSATRYTWDGKEIFRARMTAASLDDIEPVVERLSQALYARKSPEETRTINSITEREAQSKNRLFVEKVFGIKATYAVIEGVGSKTYYSPTVGFGFDTRLEGKKYFLEVGAGLSLFTHDANDYRRPMGSANAVYGELGGSYYLSDGDVSPYVGGGLMPRYLGGSQLETGPNLAAYAQAGLMFFRQSSSRLYADFRLAQNVTAWSNTPGDNDPLTGKPRSPTDATPENTHPTEFVLEVGIGW